MIAAGLGCRAGCDVDDVMLAVAGALTSAGRHIREVQALYTADFKASELGLRRAAALLDKPLVQLPLERLEAQACGALTQSARVLALFAVPSLAETAALAGAAASSQTDLARLLGPRHVSGHATCALASAEPCP